MTGGRGLWGRGLWGRLEADQELVVVERADQGTGLVRTPAQGSVI